MMNGGSTSMEMLSAGDHVLLMMLGVTVVIIALRAIARANRLKREALAREARVARQRSTDEGAPVRDGPRTPVGHH
jgi:hypothetical protein